MNILHVNDNDLIGRRFSGYDLQVMINKKKGFKSKQLVVSKSSNDSNVSSFCNNPSASFIRNKCKELEKRMNLQSVIYPFGEVLEKTEEFEKADIVHYHLIFNYFMSLYSFLRLTKKKNSIWSIHDPWAITGHCVYPVDCSRWLTGCDKCPYLNRYAPLDGDCSHEIWSIKKGIYKELDIDLVVASDFMEEMLKSSPLLGKNMRIHKIPYGIDLSIFKRRDTRDLIRKNLGIHKEDFVIMFRQDAQEWKGLSYIKEALGKLKCSQNLVILTVGTIGLLEDLKEKYRIIENEWVSIDNQMIDFYSASDLFLMPSVAEAFGLMAVESMSCSLPVIVFNGTSLPKVTFAPECGMVIERGDTGAFVKALEILISNKEESRRRGDLGRKICIENYDIRESNKKMISLYETVYRREYKNK